MSKLVRISRNQIAIVDDEDFDLVSQTKWSAFFKGKTCYAMGHTHRNGKKITLYMHALIAKTPKGMETHHKNGNGLDNRRENLEVLSRGVHRKIIGAQRRAQGLPSYDFSKHSKSSVKPKYEIPQSVIW